MPQRPLNNDRHPEVRALSAFTRVFDALWRASKGDGPGPATRRGRILRGTRSARAPQDDGVGSCAPFSYKSSNRADRLEPGARMDFRLREHRGLGAEALDDAAHERP